MRAPAQRHTAKALFAVALFLFGFGAFAQTVLEVIPLKYRTVEEVIPILTPMLARDGSLSGVRGQLIVRTTPANLQELRRILDAVDTAPRRLQITVAQDVSAQGSRRVGDVGLRTDGNLRLGVPGSGGVPRQPGVEVRVLDARSTDNLSIMQTLQVLEGNSAFIQVGQAVPVPSQTVTRTVVGGRVVEQVTSGTEYRSATTGFYVLPRTTADRVTLDISQHRDALMRHVPGMVDSQRVVTTVSGRLGEWLELGGIGQSRSVEREALLGRSSSSQSDSRNILVKVDEIR